MTETTPAPAEQAIQSGALADVGYDPGMFVPPATRDNYAQIARDQAAIRGVEPKAIMQEFAGTWQELHARQPLDGYDHLAAWARDFDPAAGSGPSGLQVLQARALESARRDPFQAVIGDQALVEQGVTAQRNYDESVAGAAAAPSVDPASGMLPNPGPLSIPADVTVGQEGAEVPQGDPSAGVETPEGTADAPAPTSGTGSPSPAPTSGESSGGSKSSKSGGGSDSSSS